jgi:hypothetical protein
MSNQLNISFGVSVTGAAIVFVANPNMPQAVIGQAYPPTSVGTITGIASPFTYGNVAGLPTGMALSASGVLSGMPTSAAGAYHPTATITDSAP